MSVAAKIIMPQKYCLGFENWDAQHSELVQLLSDAVECKKKCVDRGGHVNEELEVIFNELLKYSRNHFDYEEAKMEKINYASASTHIKEHLFFIEQVKQMYSMKRNSEAVLDLTNFLTSWFLVHMQKIDRKLADAVMQYDFDTEEEGDLAPVSKIDRKAG